MNSARETAQAVRGSNPDNSIQKPLPMVLYDISRGCSHYTERNNNTCLQIQGRQVAQHLAAAEGPQMYIHTWHTT